MTYLGPAVGGLERREQAATPHHHHGQQSRPAVLVGAAWAYRFRASLSSTIRERSDRIATLDEGTGGKSPRIACRGAGPEYPDRGMIGEGLSSEFGR
jgi:hypothetical protein